MTERPHPSVEIQAMQELVTTLNLLDDEARARVIRWLADLYKVEQS